VATADEGGACRNAVRSFAQVTDNVGSRRSHQTLTRNTKGIHRTPAIAAALPERGRTAANIVALLDSN